MIAAAALCLMALPAQAQNWSGSGQSWNGSWGFGSATERSLLIQQAQAIRQAENGQPESVVTYNNYNDNRSNYVEVQSADGATVTTDLHVGDEIGQQTYSVGSLNTGSTTISVDGNQNVVSAVNSSESNGCVDGSISTIQGASPSGSASAVPAYVAVAVPSLIGACAQP